MRKTISIGAAILLLGISGCTSQEVNEESAPQSTAKAVEAVEAEAEPENVPESELEEVELSTVIPPSEGRTVLQVLQEKSEVVDSGPEMLEDPTLLLAASRLMAIKWIEQALPEGATQHQVEAETRAALSYIKDWENITVQEATDRATDACKVIEKYGPDGLRSIYEEHPEDGEFLLVVSAATHCQQFLKYIE